MRVSVEKGDPGYATLMALGGPNAIEIYLDGHRLARGAITADSETGEVLVFKLDHGGNFVRTPAGDEFERETINGAVVIMPVLIGGQA